MEHSGFSIKKIYISGNGNPEKNSSHFRKRKFLIFRETETLKNFSYFRRELPGSKNEKNPTLKMFLIFQEMALS